MQRSRTLLLVACHILGAGCQAAHAADLKAETLEAFVRYVQVTEEHIAWQMTQGDRILYIDGLPDARRQQIVNSLRSGQVFIVPFETRDDSGEVMRAPGGLIHHWIGDVFIPGISVDHVLAMVQDYDHHQRVYRPEVVRSRLITKKGNDFKAELRFRRKKVITVTLNTEHDIHYAQIDATHWYSRSVSTRIAEVENVGRPNESEKPAGHDGGFLWRINSYWRFVERDAGVYVECESVSLTRDIPSGLSWLIKGMVVGVSRESLQHTLKSTLTGTLARQGKTQHDSEPSDSSQLP